jgi:hypothetical protein
MTDISQTAALVRPLNGAIVRRKTAGGVVNVGDAVYIASDGDVEQADADAVASAQARGIVVAVGTTGATAAAAGDPVDIVTHGPVAIGASGLTDGAAVYVSTTAGKMDQTAPAAAGDYPFVIGWAESDGVVYVQPQVIVPTVNAG